MVRTRGLLVVLGRGADACVSAGLGNHGIQGLRTVLVARVRGDEVLELPARPFFTVITT